MGMKAAVTPGIKKSIHIPRLKVTPSEIASIGKVPISYHKEESVGMTMIRYEKLQKFTAEDSTVHLDLFWKTRFCLALQGQHGVA